VGSRAQLSVDMAEAGWAVETALRLVIVLARAERRAVVHYGSAGCQLLAARTAVGVSCGTLANTFSSDHEAWPTKCSND